MKLLTRCSGILIATVLSLPASAETFRCNGKIIESGTSQDQVRQLCGQPDTENTQTSYYWVYKHHSGNYDVRVYFYANGNVERIESVQD